MIHALVTQGSLPVALEVIAAADTVAVDTETTGLELTDSPFACIIATDKHTLYFDERELGPDVWPHLLSAFNLKKRTIFLQNAKFDMKMLHRKGISLRTHTLHDCAVLSRIKRNDHMKYSLDAQAKRELGQSKDTRLEQLFKEHPEYYEVRKDYFGNEYKVPRYDRIPIADMATYALTDGRLTYDLGVKYMAELWADHAALITMESDLIHVCFEMEQYGLLLNSTYTTQAMYHEMAELVKAKQHFVTLTGKEFVNSAKSLAGVFATPLPTTEKGNPSLTDDVIDFLVDKGTPNDREVAECIRSIRHFDKRISTYYQSYLNLKGSDDVIHPQMWQAGTRTGRFSYSDPNLQNIPKEEKSKDPFVVRGCFKPRDGRVYVSFDYSQMEYRLMAAYAGEHEIIAKVNAGADFHQATADMFGVERSPAKTLNFAVLYGAGVDKIAAMLRVPYTAAKHLKQQYFMALPKVEAFIDNVIGIGKARGYVFNWMGRKMYADYEYCYALPNHLIQGGGADVVKMAMVEIHRKYSFIPMVLQVHDQLVFEMLPEDYQHIEGIKQIMESVFPPKNNIKLTVDVSWSAVSLAERDMTKGVPLAA